MIERPRPPCSTAPAVPPVTSCPVGSIPHLSGCIPDATARPIVDIACCILSLDAFVAASHSGPLTCIDWSIRPPPLKSANRLKYAAIKLAGLTSHRIEDPGVLFIRLEFLMSNFDIFGLRSDGIGCLFRLSSCPRTLMTPSLLPCSSGLALAGNDNGGVTTFPYCGCSTAWNSGCLVATQPSVETIVVREATCRARNLQHV